MASSKAPRGTWRYAHGFEQGHLFIAGEMIATAHKDGRWTIHRDGTSGTERGYYAAQRAVRKALREVER